ncbi:MAG: hypothetical protein LQ345_006980, partial [Seirophora villosa]
ALALSDDFCGPVYTATPSLGVAVSSAIGSATAAARSALSTRSPDVLGDYPACANSNVAQVSPKLSAWATESVSAVAQQCRQQRALATFLVFDLCAPVGGLQPKLESACRSDNMTTPSSTIGTASSVLFTSSPTASPITPFMGEGYALGARSLEAALAVFAGGVGVMVFLL